MRPSASAARSIRSTRHAPGTSGRACPRSRRARAERRVTRLVQRAHEVERTCRPEVAPPRLGDPVRVGVLEPRLGGACLRQRVEERPDPVGEPAKHGVGERHGALEPRTADELDRLVHRRVARDAVDEPELVRTETEGSSHRRVEAWTRRRPSFSIAWSSVRTRWTAPNASRCASARSRSSRSAAAVRNARSAYASSSNTRTRTSNAAMRAGLTSQTAKPCLVGHAAASVGLDLDRLEGPVVADASSPDVTARPCSSARAPMCGESARTWSTSSVAGRSRSRRRSSAVILSAYVGSPSCSRSDGPCREHVVEEGRRNLGRLREDGAGIVVGVDRE